MPQVDGANREVTMLRHRRAAVTETEAGAINGNGDRRGPVWLRVVSAISALVFAVLIVSACIGIEYEFRTSYCVRCGLMCERNVLFSWYHATDYNGLYHKYVSPRCRHQWRWARHGTRRIGISGWGERSSGALMPWVLKNGYSSGVSPPSLKPLSHFADSSRVAIILSALLHPHPDLPREEHEKRALRQLSPAPTVAEQDRWWRKHGAFFTALDQDRGMWIYQTYPEPERP